MYQPYRHTHAISTSFSPRPASGLHRLHANPATANQSTNDTVQHTPQPYTRHKFRAHTAPQTHSLHRHTQTHATQAPADVDDAPDADVDADAPTLTQHRCRRSPLPVRNRTGQASGRIRLNQTRQDQATRQQLDRPGIRQAACRIRPYKTKPDRIRPGQARTLTASSTGPAGRSPQIFPRDLTAD